MKSSHLRNLVLLCVFVSLTVTISANLIAKSSNQVFTQSKHKVLTESLVIQDKTGRILAELKVNEKDGLAELKLWSKKDKSVVVLRPNALWMYDNTGELKVSLILHGNGNSVLNLIDNEDKVRQY